MLVLSRKVGERILIGDKVVVTVLAIERGKLRLGFEAPRDVRITRKELLTNDRCKQAKEAVPALV